MGIAIIRVQPDDLFERLDGQAVPLQQHQGRPLAGPDVEVLGVELEGLLVRHHCLLQPVVADQGEAAGPPQQAVGRLERDGPGQRFRGLRETAHGVERVTLDPPEVRVTGEQLRSGDRLVERLLVLLLRVQDQGQIAIGTLVRRLQP